MNTDTTPHEEPAKFILPVADILTSVSFYTEKLGLELTDSDDLLWAEVSAPGIFIILTPRQETQQEPIEPIGFQVMNFDEAIAMLDEQQINYTIEKDEQVHLAYFTDPDDNVLYLFKVLDAPAATLN